MRTRAYGVQSSRQGRVVAARWGSGGGGAAMTAGRAWLPRGRPLDDDTWRMRHRSVIVLLWVHVVGLTAFGVIRGFHVEHLVPEVGGIAIGALVAQRATSRRVASTVATLALVTSSALLVHLSGGLIEAHFHFFIMVGVVTLYQDWVPFGVAMSYVVVHHGVVGAMDPTSVYNHEAAVNKPLLWAGIHGLFITGAALAGLRSWKHAEIEADRAEAAAARLQERVVRQREALRINDTVVQGLVTAAYAAELGDHDLADATVQRTLHLAQQLVADLMEGDPLVRTPGGLRQVAERAHVPETAPR